MATPPPIPPNALNSEPIDKSALAAEKLQEQEEIVEVLQGAVDALETKYLRTAFQLGRGLTGKLGSFEDAPEIDDVGRAGVNMEILEAALQRAEAKLARLKAAQPTADAQA